MKGKVYRIVVRAAMMPGLETLAIGRRRDRPGGGRAKDAEILFRVNKNGQDQERGH